MSFLKNIFGTSCNFHKSAEKFSKKILNSSTRLDFWNELAAREHSKLMTMARDLKSLATPDV
jgi:hypothetical protein